MGDLAKATTTEPTGEPGRRAALLDEQWRIGPKMHGGYLLGVLAQAALEEVSAASGHDVPEAVTSTFLRAPDPGPAVVTVDVLRRGRGVTQVRVRLDQDDTPCVEAAVVLAAGTGAESRDDDVSPDPVALTPFEQCTRRPVETDDGRGPLPLMEVVDTRIDPASTGFLSGRPTGEGRIGGWVELDTREGWTPVGVLVALDVLPPASFDLGIYGWSPTMSLTAHVHAVPAPGPLRAVQWVDHLAGERMHETCRVWDATGRMVGQATQLAAVRR